MTMVTMPLIVVPRSTPMRRRAIRRMFHVWTAALNMTAQERANAYVARMSVSAVAG